MTGARGAYLVPCVGYVVANLCGDALHWLSLWMKVTTSSGAPFDRLSHVHRFNQPFSSTLTYLSAHKCEQHAPFVENCSLQHILAT